MCLLQPQKTFSDSHARHVNCFENEMHVIVNSFCLCPSSRLTGSGGHICPQSAHLGSPTLRLSAEIGYFYPRSLPLWRVLPPCSPSVGVSNPGQMVGEETPPLPSLPHHPIPPPVDPPPPPPLFPLPTNLSMLAGATHEECQFEDK